MKYLIKRSWDPILSTTLHRDDIARRIANPKPRKLLLMLEKLSKQSSDRCSEITNSCVEKYLEVRSARGPMSAALTISPNLINLIAHDVQDERDKI